LNPISETETLQDDLLYFEDLSVGDRWESPEREISADDVADFAHLTGDHDPLHQAEGASSPFGEPVAHGLLGLSVLAGLSSDHPRAATLALVRITEWNFEAPIFFGDRVHVVTEVESVQPHGRRSGRVTWLRRLINQHGRVVQTGRVTTLVGTRARSSQFGGRPSVRRAGGALPAR
jgi:acyl dehydratase